MTWHTKGGLRIVINTFNVKCNEGEVYQITLPNGKYLYDDATSKAIPYALHLGLECKLVRYFGACAPDTINQRAHLKMPIQIEEVKVADYIGMIATDQEVKQFLKESFAFYVRQ